MKKKKRKKNIIKKIRKNIISLTKSTKSELFKALIIVAAIVIISLIVFLIYKAYLFDNKYSGLGSSKEIPLNELNLSK